MRGTKVSHFILVHHTPSYNEIMVQIKIVTKEDGVIMTCPDYLNNWHRRSCLKSYEPSQHHHHIEGKDNMQTTYSKTGEVLVSNKNPIMENKLDKRLNLKKENTSPDLTLGK